MRQLIQATVPHWQFVPIMAGGKAVATQAGMSLRIVADIADAQHATVLTAFGPRDGTSATPSDWRAGYGRTARLRGCLQR